MKSASISQSDQNGGSVLSKRAALLAAAKIAGYMLTIPLPLILVRFLDQSEFGLYKQTFALISTMLTLLGLHVSVSAYYFMPRTPEKKPQVVMNVLIFYGAVGSVTALAFALFPRWITVVFKTEDLVPYVPLIGVAIFFWLMSSLLEVVTVADGDVRSASLFTVLVQVLKSGLLLGAGVLASSIEAMVLAAVIQGALQCVILFWYIRGRFGKFWRSFDAKLFKSQLANALPFGLGALFYALQADLHIYFVSHYYDPAAFALYAIGCFQLPLLGMLLDAVISVMLPEVVKLQTRDEHHAIVVLWASAIRKLAFFYVPAYVLLFVVRYEFITLLFTKQYADSVPLFAINLAMLPLYVIVCTAVLRAFDDMKFFRLKLSLAMIPLSAFLLYFGINAAGLIGAMAAAVAVQLLDLSVSATVIARRLKMKLGDLRQFAPVLRTVAASAAAGLAAYFVRLSIEGAHSLAVLAVCSAVFGAVFLAAAFALGAVTDEEKSELARVYHAGSRKLGLSHAGEAQ
jgi:O-antigen/teichoic acid export membrane protein